MGMEATATGPATTSRAAGETLLYLDGLQAMWPSDATRETVGAASSPLPWLRVWAANTRDPAGAEWIRRRGLLLNRIDGLALDAFLLRLVDAYGASSPRAAYRGWLVDVAGHAASPRQVARDVQIADGVVPVGRGNRRRFRVVDGASYADYALAVLEEVGLLRRVRRPDFSDALMRDYTVGPDGEPVQGSYAAGNAPGGVADGGGRVGGGDDGRNAPAGTPGGLPGAAFSRCGRGTPKWRPVGGDGPAGEPAGERQARGVEQPTGADGEAAGGAAAEGRRAIGGSVVGAMGAMSGVDCAHMRAELVCETCAEFAPVGPLEITQEIARQWAYVDAQNAAHFVPELGTPSARKVCDEAVGDGSPVCPDQPGGAEGEGGSFAASCSPIRTCGESERPAAIDAAPAELGRAGRSDQQPAEEGRGEKERGEEEPAEKQPTENQPAENEPAEKQPRENQPAENEPTEKQPASAPACGSYLEKNISAPASAADFEPKPKAGEPTDADPGGVYDIDELALLVVRTLWPTDGAIREAASRQGRTAEQFIAGERVAISNAWRRAWSVLGAAGMMALREKAVRRAAQVARKRTVRKRGAVWVHWLRGHLGGASVGLGPPRPPP